MTELEAKCKAYRWNYRRAEMRHDAKAMEFWAARFFKLTGFKIWESFL